MTYPNYLNPAQFRTFKGRRMVRIQHGMGRKAAQELRDRMRQLGNLAIFRGFKAPAYVYVEGAVYHVYIGAQ